MTREYPSDWNSRRRKVYKRDNYTCQNCGAQGRNKGNAELHAHHIVPKSSGGTHQLNNLQTVCSDCHNAIHGDTQAPTAKELPDSNHGFISWWRESRADESFENCPFCDSTKISSHNQSDPHPACPKCGTEFVYNNWGFKIKKMQPDVFSPSCRDKVSGHTLSVPLWQKVGKKETIQDIDFKQLERQSKKAGHLNFLLVCLTIVGGIATYFILYQLTSSIRWMMIIGWVLIVPTGLYIGRYIVHGDRDVHKINS